MCGIFQDQGLDEFVRGVKIKVLYNTYDLAIGTRATNFFSVCSLCVFPPHFPDKGFIHYPRPRTFIGEGRRKESAD